jgi:intracellular sulfur oxidation DsrE/DsrF family protein
MKTSAGSEDGEIARTKTSAGSEDGEIARTGAAVLGAAAAPVRWLRTAIRLLRAGPDAPVSARASRRRMLTAGGLAAGSTLLASSVPAANATAEDTQPFVEHRLVLQLSDRAADKQALTLSVCYNLLKEYGPDLIAIEVVTFGPGIDLVRSASPHRARVDSLIAQGVRFSVCMNTVETVERETGKPVELNLQARKVQAGVARILALCERRYVLVRP